MPRFAPWITAAWIAVAALAVASIFFMSADCPDDLRAAADIQADMDAIAQALAGERPSHISPEDWVAAKHALLTARGGR